MRFEAAAVGDHGGMMPEHGWSECDGRDPLHGGPPYRRGGRITLITRLAVR